jgi:hypothetical protein
LSESDVSLEHHDRVSRAAELIGSALIQNHGYPINHESNAGFNRRGEVGCDAESSSPSPLIIWAGREEAQLSSDGVPRLGLSCGTSPSFWLDPYLVADGVGYRFFANAPTAAWRSPPPLSTLPSSCFRSWLSGPPVIVLGVGQSFVASVSVVPLWRPDSFVQFLETPLDFSSFEVAVGQHEDPAATMWRANISRTNEERVCDLVTQSA